MTEITHHIELLEDWLDGGNDIAIITHDEFLSKVRDAFNSNLNLVISDLRDVYEAEGRLSSCGSEGIMIFKEWLPDYGGWDHDLVSLEDEDRAELIINLAQKNILAWQALTTTILSYLTSNKPMARQYHAHIFKTMSGLTLPPKDSRFKKSEAEYRAYMMTARDIAERFMMTITRNDASETYSALDAIAEISDLSYATLKRDVYQKFKDEYPR